MQYYSLIRTLNIIKEKINIQSLKKNEKPVETLHLPKYRNIWLF